MTTLASKKDVQARRQRTKEILRECRAVCARHGGMVQIDDRYVVVDTRRYNVTPKEQDNG